MVPTATELVDATAGVEGAIAAVEETAVTDESAAGLGIWVLGGAGLGALLLAFAWLRRR